MDVVIPFRNTKTNIELTYSLRSLEGFAVFIVGDKPPGFKNYTHIPCGDREGPQFKEANIYRKLVKACMDERVSDPFVYSMDDVFYLKPPIAEDYYQGTLQDKISRTDRSNPYKKTMQQTYTALARMGLPTLHYDIHGPTVIHKDKFLQLSKFDWKKEYGYGVRSLYGNMNRVEAVSIADCKIDVPHTLSELQDRAEGRRFFSTGDKLNATLKHFLHLLWPDKSSFE